MNGYIRFLRDHVGHQPILLCGACVILENERGELLLQKRADNHCWTFSGGAVELGEKTEEAAARELFEETGLTADELELFGVFSGPNQHYIYPNRDEVHIVSIVYSCRRWHGELQAQEEEVEELRFFPPDALPEPVSPPDVEPLTAYAAAKLK